MTPPTAADRRLLPEGRLAGPMPWVIAIMMFLTALAAAMGLSMRSAANALGHGLDARLTVQVIDADTAVRDRQAAAAVAALTREPGVSAIARVGDGEMRAFLGPWLGDVGVDRDLPLPAMIDATLDAGARPRLADITAAVRRVAPAARIDDHGRWLAPLLAFVRSLGLLAGGIVALMAGATAAAVVLAARSALDTHRDTIGVMHMLGATDVQIARLFQRRIALDAAFGATAGLVGAVAVVLLIGARASAIGAGLVGTVALGGGDWILILLLPVSAGLLALLVARMTVLRALGRTL